MAFGYNTGAQLRQWVAAQGYVFEDDWFGGDTLSGMVECGVLMAASDGFLEQHEIDELADFMYGFTGGIVTAGDTAAIISGCLEALEAEGFDARVAAVATYVPTHEAARLAVTVAACVMLADDVVEENELNMFYVLADSLGLARVETETIYANMEATLDDSWY